MDSLEQTASASPAVAPHAPHTVDHGPLVLRSDDPPPWLLDPREWEIVLALCEGLPRDAVADRIGFSRSTLNRLLSEIYASTGFSQAYQVVAWAFRCGAARSGPGE